MDDMLRGHRGDVDTTLAPPETQCDATQGMSEKRERLRYAESANLYKPLQRMIITRNEQARSSSRSLATCFPTSYSPATLRRERSTGKQFLREALNGHQRLERLP
jgi:hypothetical protein